MPESGVEAVHEDEAPLFSAACFADMKVDYLLSRLAIALAEKAYATDRLARIEAVLVGDVGNALADIVDMTRRKQLPLTSQINEKATAALAALCELMVQP